MDGDYRCGETLSSLRYGLDPDFPWSANLEPRSPMSLRPLSIGESTNMTDMPYCLCGCGQQVKSETSQFAMGHDAKHKSNLIKEVLDNGPSAEAAEAELERRGWGKFLDKARESWGKTRRQKREKQREKKVGQAYDAIDTLQKMKRAGERLKEAGRYSGKEKIVITQANVDDILGMSDEELKAAPATASIVA